jgi:uncharacterized membrane protein YfcA
MQIFLILALGLGTGLLSGLLGVGGGIIMVPVFVYLFKMNVHQAVGTSLAVMVPIALIGSLKHFLGGNVELRGMVFFVLAALVGGWLGATLAQALPALVLRRVFAVFLAGAAFYMYFKS